jgi:hypothetical protein
MLGQPSPRPPQVAAWLVGFLTPYDQVETIPGDLCEEFMALASNRGDQLGF